ncbi:hypothetical protein BC936DRAFT_143198, partial [Jimgerdemannia flammicorona]
MGLMDVIRCVAQCQFASSVHEKRDCINVFPWPLYNHLYHHVLRITVRYGNVNFKRPLAYYSSFTQKVRAVFILRSPSISPASLSPVYPQHRIFRLRRIHPQKLSPVQQTPRAIFQPIYLLLREMKATKSKGHSFSIPGLTPSKSLAERLNNLDQLKTPDRTVVRKINDIHNNEFRRGSGATHSSSSSTSSSSSHIASMSKTNNTNLSPSTSNTGSRHSGSKPGSQSGTAFLHNPFKLVEGRKFANVPGLKYMLPLDDKEFLRQADEHKLLKHLFNGIYKAPIAKHLDRGIAVLDVGCGCGSWILEMAQQYPRSSFTGIDVAPIFPRTEVPQNVGFRTHNLIADNKQLPYPDATFDFVFMRNMSLAVGEKDWQNLCRELVRVTKLGGYVELLDTDFELKRRGPKLADWNDKVIFALKARGFNPRIGPNLENFFKDDLVNAKKLFFSLPMGNWGGKTGMAVRILWS